VFAGTSPAPRYDKQHLVPFGEFVPWGLRWFVDLMTIPLGDFGRGSQDQPPFAVGEQRIAFNICYEDVFGEELLPAVTRVDGATILANVSNIAWFGDSHALPQHLQIARMRTLETARPMIRATNTGVTAAIDFDGRVLAALPPNQLGALSGDGTGTQRADTVLAHRQLAGHGAFPARAWRSGAAGDADGSQAPQTR
jgi:apolipoprotein N-acyltransferase